MPWANTRHRNGALRPLGCRSGECRRLVGAQWGDLHHAGPVLPVAVLNQQQDGGAERRAVAHAAANPRAVLLNGLASAAAVAALASSHINLKGGFGERHARGHPLNNHAELWSVRLACGQESKGHDLPLYFAFCFAAVSNASRITAIGAGRPVHSSKAAAPCSSNISRPSIASAPAARAVRTSAVSPGA